MMAKNERYARLRYCECEDGYEGYSIEVYSNGAWELDTWFPLFTKLGEYRETDYIHWSILAKLRELQRFGYEIDLKF